MAIAGVLLLTASATYAVLKWRVIVPKMSKTLGDVGQLGVPFSFEGTSAMLKIIALPYISALLGAATALWSITLDESFEGTPSATLVCSHVALFCAVASFAFPRHRHWSTSTTIITSAVAAYNTRQTTKNTLAGWIVLLVFNIISCITNIFHT